MQEEVRPGRREGAGWRRRKRHVHGEGPTQGWGHQGTRGAHVEHGEHVRDAGRVEAERLVKCRRVLPRRKAGMQCGKRCGTGGVRALGGGDAIGVHAGCARLKAAEARARAERTANMKPMFVTLDVSKLSGWLNAAAFCRVERRACDAGRGAAQEA